MIQGCRVLVIGASGFIGRWVARALGAAGATLWLAGRDERRLRASCEAYGFGGTICVADLSERGAFASLYAEIRPDVTFNLAGYGVAATERDENLAHRINVDLIREVAETVARDRTSNWTGTRLIHAGSTAEYGPVHGAVTEDTAAAPISTYGRAKLEGTRAVEQTVAESGLRAIVARLFTVYGPGEHAGRLLPTLMAAARTGRTVSLTSGDQRRDFTFVSDVAEGLLRLSCVTPSRSAVVNLTTGRLTPVREFIQTAAGLIGLRPEQLNFGALPPRRDDIEQGPAENAKLRELVGWCPATAIADGIRQTMQIEIDHKGREI